MSDNNEIIPEYWRLMELTKLPVHGRSYRLHSQSLFDRIRRRLRLTEEEFPNSQMIPILEFANRQIIDFIFENPEGIQIITGNDLLGVLAISKHMPKEFREDKFQKVEDIESMEVKRPHIKKMLLRRYNTALNRRVDKQKIKSGKVVPFINLHSYMYTYRFMWFNHRNSKIIKAIAYEFEPPRKDKDRLYKEIENGRDYYELNFSDFHRKKIKPVE